MKCIVLAGGSGDALWPLSRKNYPKQFINIREGRSLFQEAVARNLPFCDEFYIVTNEKYRYIVEGQMQAFQGLSYQLFLEQLGRQTAPAVTIACMCVHEDEEVLVVSTDHLIDGGDYNGTVMAAKNLLTEENIVAIGCEKDSSVSNYSGHSAFLYDGDLVTEFMTLAGNPKINNLLLDSGIFLMKAKSFIQAIKENAKGLYEKCLKGSNRINIDRGAFIITKEWLDDVPSLSVGEVVFSNWAGSKIHVVKADFSWSRLVDIEALLQYNTPSLMGPSIENECGNVSVLNEDFDKLVVVNGCDDLLVVNTKDATYISKKGESKAIRQIISNHYESEREVFDEGDVFYTSWGIKETLTRSDGYMVRKVTIFSGKEIYMHKHEKRSEHWSVVSGIATITLDGVTKEYNSNSSVYVPVGTYHRIANEHAKDLVIIEVGVGNSAGNKTGDLYRAQDDFVKLKGVYKDYLWGGTKLYEIYGKDNLERQDHMIAESWELSAHSAGPSVVAEGYHKGMDFSKYLKKIGKEALGWKCQPFEEFPLLVKLIDATNSLSVQVHPDDEYAMRVEGEYGKNEMWYILDAEPNASLYVGFKENITPEECKERIANGTLTDVLNEVPVKKGDVIFIKAGTVHAIREGILILEIQQSSNCTYRLYDYNRVDQNGNKRPLHIEKALENMDLTTYDYSLEPAGEKEEGKGYTKRLLGQCKYFNITLIEVLEHAEIPLDDTSFSSIVFLSGKGRISTELQSSDFAAGDSYFVPARKKILRIDGKCQFVISRV